MFIELKWYTLFGREKSVSKPSERVIETLIHEDSLLWEPLLEVVLGIESKRLSRFSSMDNKKRGSHRRVEERVQITYIAEPQPHG